MKKHLLITLLLTTTANYFLLCQAPAIELQNTIGGSNSENLYSIQQTSDGGYILGGESNSGISGDKNEASLGSYDYWVVKINNTGGIEWQNTIGGTGDDFLRHAQQTMDGGYIVGGYSYSGISGDKTEASLGDSDYWVIKLDASGAIVWQNTIGGNGGDKLYSMQQTSDEGYILGGASSSAISGDKTEASMGGNDYWIVKLDDVGNITWQNTIGGSSADELYSMQQTSDGGYIVGGDSFSGISGDKTENNVDLIEPFTPDYWVIKLDASGSIEWQNTIGGNSYDNLRSIQQTTDGGFILGGNSSSGISGDKTESALGFDCWAIKLNSSGNIEWQNTLGGSGAEGVRSICQTADGGYLIGAYSNSGISGDKTEASSGGYDYWPIKLNGTGSILWQNVIGGSSTDFLLSVQQTLDGGYMLGGYSSSGISGDKTEGNLGLPATYDYWVIKLESECIISPEICNALDDNCNGLIDDGISETISISAGGATTFCQGGSVLLTATYSGTSVQWKKNGNPIPGATSPTYSANKSGNYTCETSSACDTELSNSISVTVNKNPAASISAAGSTTFCAGGSVTLNEVPVGGSTYQWYKGASAIAGATTTSYVATTAGNYKCRVTKIATGCYKNSNAISVTVPCREDNFPLGGAGGLFTIYPNPSTGTFTIAGNGSPLERGRPARSDQSDGGVSVEIYNSLGQHIYSQQINSVDVNINETIELNDVAKGIYVVRIKNGENIKEQKLIIE